METLCFRVVGPNRNVLFIYFKVFLWTKSPEKLVTSHISLFSVEGFWSCVCKFLEVKVVQNDNDYKASVLRFLWPENLTIIQLFDPAEFLAGSFRNSSRWKNSVEIVINVQKMNSWVIVLYQQTCESLLKIVTSFCC